MHPGSASRHTGNADSTGNGRNCFRQNALHLHRVHAAMGSPRFEPGPRDVSARSGHRNRLGHNFNAWKHERRSSVAGAPHTCLLASSPLHSEGRLTPRSSGAPTAGHQARSGGTRYIFASPGPASCRRRPLSSLDIGNQYARTRRRSQLRWHRR